MIEHVSWTDAFVAGLLGVANPALWPVLLLLIVTAVGVAAGTLARQESLEPGTAGYLRRRSALVYGLSFLAGYSVVFFFQGLGAGEWGQWMLFHQTLFVRTGGIVTVLAGLWVWGFRPRVPMRWVVRGTVKAALALLLGFAAGWAWVPSGGPVLGSIIIMSETPATSTQGFSLLFIYSCGQIISSLIVLAPFNMVLRRIEWTHLRRRWMERVCGVLLLMEGIIAATGLSGRLYIWIQIVSDPWLEKLTTWGL